MDLIKDRSLRCILLFTLTLALVTQQSVRADAGNSPLNWSKLSYKASKFGLGAEANIQLDFLDRNTFSAQLINNPQLSNLTPKHEQSATLTLSSSFVGRHMQYTAWLELPSGRALQSSRIRGDKTKLYRFGESGVIETRSSAEESHTRVVTLATDTLDKPLIQPIYLFYLVSHSRELLNPGDSVQRAIYADNRIYDITLTVVNRLNYTTSHQVGDTATTLPKRVVSALQISVTAFLQENKLEQQNVSLAGLDDGLVFFVDEETRLPLELQGNMRMFGKIRYRLQHAWLSKLNSPE